MPTHSVLEEHSGQFPGAREALCGFLLGPQPQASSADSWPAPPHTVRSPGGSSWRSRRRRIQGELSEEGIKYKACG